MFEAGVSPPLGHKRGPTDVYDSSTTLNQCRRVRHKEPEERKENGDRIKRRINRKGFGLIDK